MKSSPAIQLIWKKFTPSNLQWTPKATGVSEKTRQHLEHRKSTQQINTTNLGFIPKSFFVYRENGSANWRFSFDLTHQTLVGIDEVDYGETCEHHFEREYSWVLLNCYKIPMLHDVRENQSLQEYGAA